MEKHVLNLFSQNKQGKLALTMDEELIENIKLVLTDWNPLGGQASQILDLENYQTEAIDILFYLDKKSSINYINKIMVEVLSQAFGLDLKLEETKKYAMDVAQGPIIAVRAIKRAVYNGLNSDLRGHLDYVSSQLALLTQTKEHQEAVKRFVEKKSEV